MMSLSCSWVGSWRFGQLHDNFYHQHGGTSSLPAALGVPTGIVCQLLDQSLPHRLPGNCPVPRSWLNLMVLASCVCISRICTYRHRCSYTVLVQNFFPIFHHHHHLQLLDQQKTISDSFKKSWKIQTWKIQVIIKETWTSGMISSAGMAFPELIFLIWKDFQTSTGWGSVRPAFATQLVWKLDGCAMLVSGRDLNSKLALRKSPVQITGLLPRCVQKSCRNACFYPVSPWNNSFPNTSQHTNPGMKASPLESCEFHQPSVVLSKHCIQVLSWPSGLAMKTNNANSRLEAVINSCCTAQLAKGMLNEGNFWGGFSFLITCNGFPCNVPFQLPFRQYFP